MGDYLKTANYKNTSTNARLLADKVFNTTKDRLVNASWQPMITLARTTIVALMEKIQHGQLRILTTDAIWTFGNPQVAGREVPLTAQIKVLDDKFWLRLVLLADLGFSEAYMDGDIEVDDLEAIFIMFILNRANLSEMSTTTSHIFTAINYLMSNRFVNSISNSMSNISAHYDISNRMFSSFLSKDMTYSCAIWSEDIGGIYGDLDRKNIRPTEEEIRQGRVKVVSPRMVNGQTDELETAQMNKINRILKKAQIREGDRVLEIGSGWGSFAIHAARTKNCTVDSLTLSVEQKVLAEQRIAEAGLQDKVRIHLMDYRNIPPEFERAFDRVVSIEMIEAVGLEYLETYFEIVEKALKKDRGLAVFQVITIPESRFDRYKNEIDFIRKWIFPGGVLPSVTFLVDAIAKGSKGNLVIDSVENIGPHYSRTLREWRRRFEATFESEIVPALKEAYPEIKSRKPIETFKRKWIYYFMYSSAGFSQRVLGDHIFTIIREGISSL